MKIINRVLMFVGVAFLASCSLFPEKKPSSEKNISEQIHQVFKDPKVELAERKISDFKLNKSSFYGFRLLKPVPRLTSSVSIKKDLHTGGTKYILPDPENTFSIITLYQNNGLLTRITLIRKDTNSAKSDAFYKMLMDQAEKKYPKDILVDSSIGAYMHFYNSEELWKNKYIEFIENKNNNDTYKLTLDNFHYGLHDTLSTISFDQYPGRENEIYVKVDYITSNYEDAVIGEIEQIETASGFSDI